VAVLVKNKVLEKEVRLLTRNWGRSDRVKRESLTFPIREELFNQKKERQSL